MYLYYVKIKGFYKIGRTVGNIVSRFGGYKHIEVIHLWEGESKAVKRAEAYVIKHHKERLNPITKEELHLPQGGVGECFRGDVLDGTDYKVIEKHITTVPNEQFKYRSEPITPRKPIKIDWELVASLPTEKTR